MIFDAKLATLENILGGRLLSVASRRGVRGLRKLYYVKPPITLAWIDELVEVVQGDLGSNPSVDARFRVASKGSTEHVFRDIATWRSEMPASWNELGAALDCEEDSMVGHQGHGDCPTGNPAGPGFERCGDL